MKSRLFTSAVLLVFLSVSCQPKPTPVPDAVRPTVTPTVPCDLVEELAPERPKIPRPATIPIPAITVQPARSANARSDLVDAKFYSPLIGKELPILIYLPPGYADSSQRYPVLYMLSGWVGDYREWVAYGLCHVLDTLIRGGAVQPMIFVTPEGERSW
jgi:hypothetical protein